MVVFHMQKDQDFTIISNLRSLTLSRPRKLMMHFSLLNLGSNIKANILWATIIVINFRNDKKRANTPTLQPHRATCPLATTKRKPKLHFFCNKISNTFCQPSMQTTTLSKWLVPQQLTPPLRFQCCQKLLFLHLVFCLAFVATQRYHLSPPLHPPNMVHDNKNPVLSTTFKP